MGASLSLRHLREARGKIAFKGASPARRTRDGTRNTHKESNMKPLCPQCGCDNIAQMDTVPAMARIENVTTEGDALVPAYAGGSKILWNEQRAMSNPALYICYNCDYISTLEIFLRTYIFPCYGHLRGVLYCCSKSERVDPLLARGAVNGVMSTLMAQGASYEEALKVVVAHMPTDWDRERVPPAWKEDIERIQAAT